MTMNKSDVIDPPLPDLLHKASQLPSSPGVYLMHDRKGAVIYVGKAKSLANRVRSYFRKQPEGSHKTRIMVSMITGLDTILTPTEKDALILENSLIKKLRPRFNVLLRDDKEYPYLRLSLTEPYPNLTIVRKPKKDAGQYFGPFASSRAVRETLRAIHRLFPLRKCARKKLQQGRPCLYFQLGQCLAPCSLKVDREEYMQAVRDVQLFLQGRGGSVIAGLKKSMEQEAHQQHFERAARIRDRIAAIEKTLEKQSVVSLDFADRDVFSYCRHDSRMSIMALFVRGGRIIGSRNFFLQSVRLPDEEALSSFVAQYYHQGNIIPGEVLMPCAMQDRAVLQEWLGEARGGAVNIVCPRRGPRRKLVAMATSNAEIMLQKRMGALDQTAAVLRNLQKKLHLQNFPLRIECFDISNIAGTSSVGSMAVFENGTALKDDYRRFRIKNVRQPNDYAMMYEVLTRRLERARQDNRLPDLMIVDGGKGQLGVLLQALHDQGTSGVDAIALAKKKQFDEHCPAKTDRVFLPYRKNSVDLAARSPELLLLQRIRDEAHRFAITYHRNLKKKNDFTSAIEALQGIGPETAKALLKFFGSLEQASRASLAELMQVPLSRKRAQILYGFFHPEEEG